MKRVAGSHPISSAYSYLWLEKMQFRTDIDEAIARMVDEGVFLTFLMEELHELGYTLTQRDKRHFQRELWLIGNSQKRPHAEKMNVISNLIEDTINAVEKMVEYMNQTEHRIAESRKTEGPQCLTPKRGKIKQLVHDRNIHTEKNSLQEVKWIYRRKDGRPLGRLQKEGNKVALYGFGKGVLGWYLPKAGPPHGYTIDKFGKIVGFGNLLGTLLNEGH